MQLEKYNLEIDDSLISFTFISEGHLGKIEKAIQYDEMQEGIYNLGFGDKHPLTGQIDDTIVTNNGDMPKILATVVLSMYIFTENNPNIWIYVTGSSTSRIRLYRMAINKYYKEISKDFFIYISLEDEEWYPFEPNTKTKKFLIQRKT
jgi:hypothetical protein